jgi:hypothetical protein
MNCARLPACWGGASDGRILIGRTHEWVPENGQGRDFGDRVDGAPEWQTLDGKPGVAAGNQAVSVETVLCLRA